MINTKPSTKNDRTKVDRMNNYNTTAIKIEQPCIHDVRVDTQSGQIITYCTKCGAILDTKPVYKPYGGI